MTSVTNLRALAEMAGVSHVTVSRAWNNDRWVRESTRERIMEIVRRTGYRPNPLVSAAMAQRRSASRLACSTTIAYLNCHTDCALWQSSPSQTRFFEGAKERAEELGFGLEEFRLFERGMTPQRMERMLKSRAIAGLIVGSFQCAHAHLSLDWSVFAAVAQGFSLIKPSLHRAANHYINSTEIALRALRRLGYRRIGLAISAEVEARCQHGFSAGLSIYQQQTVASDNIPVLNSDLKDPDILGRWYSRYRPQAILTPHVSALESLDALGLRVPRDVALVHTDWHPIYIGWAGVDHRVETAGRAAADVVITQLFTNQRGLPCAPTIVLTRGEWQEGESVRKIDVPAPLPRQPRSVTVKD